MDYSLSTSYFPKHNLDRSYEYSTTGYVLNIVLKQYSFYQNVSGNPDEPHLWTTCTILALTPKLGFSDSGYNGPP